MKNQRTRILAACIALAAILSAAGSRTFLGPCVHDDGSFGVCHWAGEAMFGIALLLCAQSLTAVLVKSGSMRRGLFAAMLLTAILGILLPGTLIPLCQMATMRCRMLMRPGMTILFALMGIAAAAGAFLSGESSVEKQKRQVGV